MAFSNGDGSFNVTNNGVLDLVAAGPNGTFLWHYPSYADDAGVKLLGGDFNNDGLSDVAAVGGSGWSFIAVALASGGGNFRASSPRFRASPRGRLRARRSRTNSANRDPLVPKSVAAVLEYRP